MAAVAFALLPLLGQMRHSRLINRTFAQNIGQHFAADFQLRFKAGHGAGAEVKAGSIADLRAAL